MGSLHPEYPASNASALVDRFIRRRGNSPKVSQGPSFSSLSPVSVHSAFFPDTTPQIPEINVEDKDDAVLRPPILLIQKHPSSPSPILPFSQRLEHPSQHDFRRSEEDAVPLEDALDTVVLTPRPDILERAQSGSLCATETPQAPYLPTPDFSAPRAVSYSNIFDFFRGPLSSSRPKLIRSGAFDSETCSDSSECPRTRAAQSTSSGYFGTMRESVMNRLGVPSFEDNECPTSGSGRPQHSRSGSSSSAISSTSGQSRASVRSIDSGRAFLFSGVETTDKFTHRWPKPATINYPNRRSSTSRGISYLDSISDEIVSDASDVGLGFERVGRWSNYKWCLLVSVLSVLGYSIAALMYSILTWYQTWEHSDIMLVADIDVLILVTLSASLLLLAAIVGLTGTLLNSRPLLAIYTVLLWPALISVLSVGYIAYKRATFALDRKLNLAWSQWYSDAGRAVVQDGLQCCGFSDPTHEAVLGPRCYPRTPRPGCKGPLLRFERANLNALWRAAFAAVPLHLLNVVVALLCANHISRAFGKGLMPRRYRLRADDVREDAFRLLEHFARGGAARAPPLMARTESVLGCGREDREEVQERAKSVASSLSSVSTLRRIRS
ncbi:hypothetical protein M0805_001467 [Coniferiporia weirii]|nr:hypothetical protein M0805_001467 [Coniferiporia weirii]